MNNQVEKSFNNNYFRNDLEEIKNNFVKIKSMISQKRKPEENIQFILEKINNYGNSQTTNNNGNCGDGEVTNKNNDSNNEDIFKNENINSKRVKKLTNKDKSKANKKFGLKKNDNKNIDYYFDKKDNINQNSKTTDNKKINKKSINNHFQENNKNNNLIENGKDFLFKINEEINKNFSIIKDGKDSKIKYNNNFLRKIKNTPREIKDFYSLDSNFINSKNKSKYLSVLKNYCLKYNSLNEYNKININNYKLIYIHDCFNKLKKIPKETNTIINPRNYLIKDEFLIDYEKDSIDDYLEENAEDIKSNDDEDEEEDDEEVLFNLNQKEINEFIVPDGHLSQDELSDNDIIEDRKIFEKSKNKLIDIKTILNIRKNYIKPIIIDFTKNDKNDKILIISKKLTIGLFCYDYIKDNNENNFNLCEKEKFPLIIKNKDRKYKGIQDSINNHFYDIIKIIHGSYDTKEHLISEINQKYSGISKNVLNNFFKEKCIKFQRKYWIVKNIVLNQFNLNINEIDNIKKENYNKYKEKEENKLKEGKKTKEEKKITKKDNNINNNKNLNKKENEINKDKENIFEVKKSKILDKILIESKDYEEISIEILDSSGSNDSNEIKTKKGYNSNNIHEDKLTKENEVENFKIFTDNTNVNVINNKNEKRKKIKKEELDYVNRSFCLDINEIKKYGDINSDISIISNKNNKKEKNRKAVKEGKKGKCKKPKSRSRSKAKDRKNSVNNEFIKKFLSKKEK